MYFARPPLPAPKLLPTDIARWSGAGYPPLIAPSPPAIPVPIRQQASLRKAQLYRAWSRRRCVCFTTLALVPNSRSEVASLQSRRSAHRANTLHQTSDYPWVCSYCSHSGGHPTRRISIRACFGTNSLRSFPKAETIHRIDAIKRSEIRAGVDGASTAQESPLCARQETLPRRA